MNLRDAKAQVERDQPHLTGTAKVQAIKELREQAAGADAEPRKGTGAEGGVPSSRGVGKAWAWLLIFTGGMTGIAFAVWGTLSGAPSWFHALFGAQTLWAIVGLVNVYKRQPDASTRQEPL
jgi:hypothetical protein